MSLRLALTGGIGSGKSTASAAFSDLGATIIDADRIAREVVARGSRGFDAVVARFGEQVVGSDGELNRPALGAIVFGDDEARADLNAIVHPAVREEAARQLREAQDGNPRAITIEDIPLLTETDGAPRFHGVIVVHTDEDVRLERLRSRGMTESDARARMRAQATDGQRAAIADVVLDNNGSIDDLRQQIAAVWESRILPYGHALAVGRAPAVSDAQKAISHLSFEARRGMIERAARRLEYQWQPHGGVVGKQNACSEVDIVLFASPGDFDADTVMASAGLVPDGRGRYVSADPGAWVLVARQNAG